MSQDPGTRSIGLVMFAGLIVGLVIGHFDHGAAHTWYRQSFADQQALTLLCLFVALSYSMRWWHRTPADERDRYWTQAGAVVTFVALAIDKQYWSVSNYLYATKSPFHDVIRNEFAWINLAAVIGIYAGVLMMVYPWCQKWIGPRLWWLPWAGTLAIWGVAFEWSGRW